MADKPKAGSKPGYPIPWIATYFLAGLTLIVGSFALVWYASQFSSDFDYADPDMKFLERIVLSAAPHRADFSALNGGHWQALCLAGWRGDLARALKAAKIPELQASQLLKRAQSIEQDIEESEFLLVYSGAKGGAKALRHPHGFAFAQPSSAACISRGQPVLEIPLIR